MPSRAIIGLELQLQLTNVALNLLACSCLWWNDLYTIHGSINAARHSPVAKSLSTLPMQ